MPTKVTYYAIVDDYSTRDEPAGVLRRTETDDGQNVEQFGVDLEWTYSPLLYSYERGNMDNQLYQISEDEANQIVERIRRTVTGEQNLSMRGYVGVTDGDWYLFLADRPQELREVNFWRPGGGQAS